jgi:hypothetical protein
MLEWLDEVERSKEIILGNTLHSECLPFSRPLHHISGAAQEFAYTAANQRSD